jgi:hypothetical protein
LCGDYRRHHRSPISAKKPAGQDPGLREKACPFWIILLLVSRDPAQGSKLAAPRLQKKAR